jgi:hypothetical protein
MVTSEDCKTAINITIGKQMQGRGVMGFPLIISQCMVVNITNYSQLEMCIVLVNMWR